MIEAAVALLVVISASPAQATAPVPTAAPPSAAELKSRIDAYVQPFLEDGHLSGTLLVARGANVLYERSFGMADYELGVANTVLVPTGDRTLLSLADYATVTVVTRPNGSVERLDWPAGDRVLTMPRADAPPPAP